MASTAPRPRKVELCEKLAQAPRNRWLAVDPEDRRLVGTGGDIETALAEAKERGVCDPILVWSPASPIIRV